MMYLRSKETTRDRSLAVVMMVRDLGDCGQVSLIRAKKRRVKLSKCGKPLKMTTNLAVAVNDDDDAIYKHQ